MNIREAIWKVRELADRNVRSAGLGGLYGTDRLAMLMVADFATSVLVQLVTLNETANRTRQLDDIERLQDEARESRQTDRIAAAVNTLFDHKTTASGARASSITPTTPRAQARPLSPSLPSVPMTREAMLHEINRYVDYLRSMQLRSMQKGAIGQTQRDIENALRSVEILRDYLTNGDPSLDSLMTLMGRMR